ncbi:hypothetical protein C8R48DRAFT_768093 [Suillus tomentosus]|nr:hypothetical protein C8R48DRAFT_768093 [Suillus tomentosus]
MSDHEDQVFNNNDNDLATFTFQGATRQGDQDKPHPFNLADVPSSVEAEDALPQSDIFECLFMSQDNPHPTGCTWEQTKGNRATAINLLYYRFILCLDDKFYYPNDDEMLAWDTFQHFLDFCLVIGGSVGLHTLLLNKMVNHTFSIALNLCLPTHLFGPKISKLGFDPMGCMMALGTSPSSELRLAFFP